MTEIDVAALQPGDVVLVKRTAEGGLSYTLGRVAQIDFAHRGETHVVIWGAWREENLGTKVRDFPVFSEHFSREEPGLQIFRIGKWVNRKLKTQENEARWLLSEVLLCLKSTILIKPELMRQIDEFLHPKPGAKNDLQAIINKAKEGNDGH